MSRIAMTRMRGLSASLLAAGAACVAILYFAPMIGAGVIATSPQATVRNLADSGDKKTDKKEEEPKGDPVDVDKLPKAVVEAVKKTMPGARITKAAKLEDGNYYLDDVKVGKKLWDVTVSPEGKIIKKVEMQEGA